MNVIWLLTFLLASCTGIPKGVTPVEEFDIARYTGEWYEIARLENRFEAGLDEIKATYTLADDGAITVINRGKDVKTGEWKSAQGRGLFIDKPTIGRLKVSFFAFIFGSYNIIELDKESYRYALVTGRDRSYLWILSRTPTLAPEILDKLIKSAKDKGFDTDKLVWVKHTS